MSDPVSLTVSFPTTGPSSFTVSSIIGAEVEFTGDAPGSVVEIGPQITFEVLLPQLAPVAAIILERQGPQGIPGVPGTAGVPGLPGVPGVPGANAQTQILTLAAYLALSPAQQLNGTWYAIPRTS